MLLCVTAVVAANWGLGPTETAQQVDSRAPVWVSKGWLQEDVVSHVLSKLPGLYEHECPEQEEGSFEFMRCSLLPVGDDKILRGIVAKVAQTWDVDVESLDSLPVVRFLAGMAGVQPHSDHTNNGGGEMPDRTLLIRLTEPAADVPAGAAGELVFPHLGQAGNLTLRPSKGELVAFRNVDDRGGAISLTEHTVRPLATGAADKLSIVVPLMARLAPPPAGRLVARSAWAFCSYWYNNYGWWSYWSYSYEYDPNACWSYACEWEPSTPPPPPSPAPPPPPSPEPPLPPVAPTPEGALFEIVSGHQHCFTSSEYTCVSNYDGETEYSNNENCVVRALEDILVTASKYRVEACCDYITIGSLQYLGETNAPKDVLMVEGETLEWTSDFSVSSYGFTLCAVPATAITVGFSLTLSGTVDDYTQPVTDGIAQSVAGQAGIDVSVVSVAVTAGSVRLDIAILVADDESAQLVEAALSPALTSNTAATDMIRSSLSLYTDYSPFVQEVVSLPTTVAPPPSPPPSPPAPPPEAPIKLKDSASPLDMGVVVGGAVGGIVGGILLMLAIAGLYCSCRKPKPGNTAGAQQLTEHPVVGQQVSG